MQEYEKQIKQFMDNKATTAELEIHNGMSLKTAAMKFGYKSTMALIATVAQCGKYPPLTQVERDHFKEQVRLRAPKARDRERIAKIVGVGKDTVDNWAYGKTAPIPCLVNNIARAFGCKRDDLFKEAAETVPRGAEKHSIKKASPTPDVPPEHAEPKQDALQDLGNAITITPPRKRITITKKAVGEFAHYELMQDGSIAIDPQTSPKRMTPDELFRFGEELQVVATELI